MHIHAMNYGELARSYRVSQGTHVGRHPAFSDLIKQSWMVV